MREYVDECEARKRCRYVRTPSVLAEDFALDQEADEEDFDSGKEVPASSRMANTWGWCIDHTPS